MSTPAPTTPVDSPDAPPATTHGYGEHKDDYRRRLRRIEGQVRGLARMVEEDVYCLDILTQVSAVNRALQGVAVGLVQDHLAHCVTDAITSAADGSVGGRDAAEAKVAEASAAITRLLKS